MGRSGSSVTGTVRRTCSIGEISSMSSSSSSIEMSLVLDGLGGGSVRGDSTSIVPMVEGFEGREENWSVLVKVNDGCVHVYMEQKTGSAPVSACSPPVTV